jgi:hypothetical protein
MVIRSPTSSSIDLLIASHLQQIYRNCIQAQFLGTFVLVRPLSTRSHSKLQQQQEQHQQQQS